MVRFVTGYRFVTARRPVTGRDACVGRSGVGYKLPAYAPRMEAWKAMRGCEGAALRVFPATKDCMAAPCHDAYLMREVIRGHQRSSEVIRRDPPCHDAYLVDGSSVY